MELLAELWFWFSRHKLRFAVSLSPNSAHKLTLFQLFSPFHKLCHIFSTPFAGGTFHLIHCSTEIALLGSWAYISSCAKQCNRVEFSLFFSSFLLKLHLLLKKRHLVLKALSGVDPLLIKFCPICEMIFCVAEGGKSSEWEDLSFWELMHLGKTTLVLFPPIYLIWL